MKMQIEIEVDFIHEDETLDEAFVNEIKSSIIKSVEDKTLSKIEDLLKPEIHNKQKEALSKLDELITKTYDDFLSRDIVTTDRWGDNQKTFNIKESLKEKLDKFMTEKVGEGGKPTSYAGNYRYEYILNKQHKKQVNEFMDELSKTVIAGIKEDIDHAAKEKVTKAILSDYDLKKLIK